ncbi:LuxE/PaaK family acyltransferase [Candidatus Pelagibacter sp.]|uniref:LuxE/PaaK family acyltransferase n=1 Tax=Candidatus Pelagibacter sp. TaxID=2024849 RepID=UPI003F86D871
MINLKKLFSIKPFETPDKLKDAYLLENQKKLSKYHYRNCLEYKNICDKIFKKIENCKKLDELPYVHVKVFKEFNLSSAPKKNLSKVMQSSGTSGGLKSKINIDRNTSLIQSKALINIFSTIIKKKTTFFFIEDIIQKDKNLMSASIAAIRGFMQLSDKSYFINKKKVLNIDLLKNFIKKYPNKEFVIFGFTNNIWIDLINVLKKRRITLPKNKGILIHGGGWKKLEKKSVSKIVFNKTAKKVLGLNKVYNYYGMVEQTGSVYIECEKNFFHPSIFSQIFIRDKNLSLAREKEIGLIQTMSLLQFSYPGNNILTEDLGRIEGIDDCECGRKGKYFSIIGRVPGTEKRGCSDA